MGASRQPALFIGHGSPMNTLEDNRCTLAWRALGASLSRPKAILAISAHWYIPALAVTAMETPPTIHDFAGFPQALFDYQYPAPGSPALARRVQELLAPPVVDADHSWGLDHGTWSVLAQLFPTADIPVVQISIASNRPHEFQYELGKRLAPLRDEGILILASGNVVHNLRAIRWEEDALPHPWASRFENKVKNLLLNRDHAALIEYLQIDAEAKLAVPTPEHYLPLLTILGTQQDEEVISLPVEGIAMGALSMLAVAVGLPASI